MSRLPLYREPNSTKESHYTMETFSQLYDIEKLTEGTFLLNFETIDHYQYKGLIVQSQLLSATYSKETFCGGREATTIVMHK